MADNGEGDRMFCHACGGVWLRDGHGLTCPHCQSDFTEIIEIPPDTEEPHNDRSTPPYEQTHRPPMNPWADHNPWAHEEPDDTHGGGNGLRHRTYRSPDGRFTFSSTTFRHGFGDRSAGPPRGAAEDPLMPMVRSLDTIFHGLADTYRDQGRRESQQEEDPWGGGGRNTYGHDEHDRERYQEYRPGRRLFPRDANGPQPMAPPVGTLGDILELFRADFNGGAPGGGGVRVMTGPNPMAMLSTLLNFDRHGDAVYSQEELDRVISQLIDQNMNGEAPPPANQDAIRSLPTKKVDQDMLGSDGKAECSICMEQVQLETEVTVLPCNHWFHYNCIEPWLSQHNTCPHCRRPITSSDSEHPEGSRENPVHVDDADDSFYYAPRRGTGRLRSTEPIQGAGPFEGTGPLYEVNPSDFSQWPLPSPRPISRTRRDRLDDNPTASSGGFTNWVRNHFSRE